MYNCTEIQHAIGDTARHLIFPTYCDRMQHRICHISSAFNLVRGNRYYGQLDTFTKADSTREEVKKAGENFILKLYSASNFKSLNEYCYIAYKQAIGRSSRSSSFQLLNLAPISTAAKQHSYRTYLAVQQWMGNPLPPTEWGWQFPKWNSCTSRNRHLCSLGHFTEHDIMGCKCHGCGNMTCSCKKLGLFCTSMCSNCIGQSCNNTEPTLNMIDEDTPETKH